VLFLELATIVGRWPPRCPISLETCLSSSLSAIALSDKAMWRRLVCWRDVHLQTHLHLKLHEQVKCCNLFTLVTSPPYVLPPIIPNTLIRYPNYTDNGIVRDENK
jgi:hypothetical protein